MADLLSIILAAGEGTRMKSALPKVLHPVGGLPVVSHVLRTAKSFGSRIAVVVGPGHEAVEQAVTRFESNAFIARQLERLGTGHAVQQAREAFQNETGNVLVLYADTPLVTEKTIGQIVGRLDAGADMVVVGFRPHNPTGYGRLLTDGNRLLAIREHKDASDEERRVGLCNSGIIAFNADTLRAVIDRIDNKNAKGEYYLTDAVELAVADKRQIDYIEADASELVGVDNRTKLAEAEATFQQFKRAEMMENGVTLRDPQSVFFSWDTECGRDVTIFPNVVFGPGVKIADNVEIRAFCDLEDVVIGDGASIGPFARVRGGAELGKDVHVGNFVEVKKSKLADGVKAGHLSYLGDAEIGAKTNIGAGTITCNYDGVNKDKTVIGANAFIGSNASLVAPVVIGDGAYTASGSVITEDVPADAVAFGRARQENKADYAPKLRERALAKKAAKGK
ncbi:bifunctional UDP-N-acetylglucosamine diphosphorylase/glucosamine-1-phosphate N-acetyltransferase GlmU [Devosia sp. MC521]|uniref:bifunctional UDP-N-acetylglucosamine diphosphorylase/glucosamine-1-phosphate N-acetyltransferase GlmU n=1 Tax=Devosia sp. MC521 TaxID=2759954 RepID=UPI0015F7E7D3|nr:bifunctional UDP-N-acetylglucosamine diphosphorylase/glucosamine-1-phosphate N-acetyltransferase GlmU [Devosia sp. MC521]MBJ6985930.1 bifunctional UDP-N-acetylglucosamine diphosphorylase/glucosamine-1-phosphate N-acetyltransferase GlmU [Devosia sp. MC521]QMW61307.1 bifunctional UDP-N-acetylglucosamine diphosphorylase/glucosamine-1-phosphate N-acetyltransferase GlmU [Devosia sp. MC521]